MAKNTLKNLLYRARRAGMQINSKAKVIYLERMDMETGRFSGIREKLRGEFGYAEEMVMEDTQYRKVLIFAHNIDVLDNAEKVSARLKKFGSFPVIAPTSFRLALEKIVNCHSVVFLEGWQKDMESILLLQVAERLGVKPIFNIN